MSVPPPVVQLLTELIRVPSVNPAHNAPPWALGESRMADKLSGLLAARGLAVERLEVYGPERPSVVGRAGPADAARSLMVEMHLDTVGTVHMTLPPFEGLVKDGRVYGRGACDMKGATAAFLHALTPERVRDLTARGIRLLVVGAPDEECGTKGAATLAERGVRADHAVILEPTRCRPVIAHKGANWYEIRLRGKSGHGSRPEAGVSTNEALVRFLPELVRAHKALQQMHTHPLLGQSTLNIGKILGGQSYNIIPDHTTVLLDRRVVPTEKPELFEHAVRHILEELKREGRILDGEMLPTNQTPAFHTRAQAPLPLRLADAAEAVTGTRPEAEGTSWVSDAAPFGQVCGETVVFGPGDIAQAHTEDEYIEIAELEKGAAIFARFLDDYEKDGV